MSGVNDLEIVDVKDKEDFLVHYLSTNSYSTYGDIKCAMYWYWKVGKATIFGIGRASGNNTVIRFELDSPIQLTADLVMHFLIYTHGSMGRPFHYWSISILYPLQHDIDDPYLNEMLIANNSVRFGTRLL